MNVWEFLTTNLILDLSIISWAIAQVLKGLIILIRERRLNIARMLEGGGMPSSHAAFVCTCATAVGRMYGWGSPLFAIAAVVAIVAAIPLIWVVKDSDRLRRDLMAKKEEEQEELAEEPVAEESAQE